MTRNFLRWGLAALALSCGHTQSSQRTPIAHNAQPSPPWTSSWRTPYAQTAGGRSAPWPAFDDLPPAIAALTGPQSPSDADLATPSAVAERIEALAVAIRTHFQAGRDFAALRDARSLGALLAVASPPMPPDGSDDVRGRWLFRTIEAARAWAFEAQQRALHPTRMVRALPDESMRDRVTRLLTEATECVRECAAIDEIEQLRDAAVPSLIDAIERDPRVLRIPLPSLGILSRPPLWPRPASLREIITPIVIARLDGQRIGRWPSEWTTDARAQFARELRELFALRRGQTAEESRLARWTAPDTSCDELRRVALGWVQCRDAGRRPQYCALLEESHPARGSVARGVAPWVARCGLGDATLVSMLLRQLAMFDTALETLASDASRSTALFVATAHINGASTEQRRAFELRFFDPGDAPRTAMDMAARLDALRAVERFDDVRASVTAVLRRTRWTERARFITLLDRSDGFRHTPLALALAREHFANRSVIGTLDVDAEHKATVTIEGHSTAIAVAPDAPVGRSAWRHCDDVAFAFCPSARMLAGPIATRDALIAQCSARGIASAR